MNTKEFKIVTTVTIGQQRVSDLLCGAIEGGSNYWCKSIDRMGGITKKQAEYRQDVPFVDGGWLDVVADDDEKIHRLDLAAIEKGLSVMAEKYPIEFRNFVEENDDAGTSDTFLQCCLFGETIYG